MSSYPAQYPNPYASSVDPASRRAGGFRVSRLARLFKFPQMDFEVAIWEMTNLFVAPKKVWRNVYYRVKTKNTYTATDPAFPYLLSFFLLLTSFAWSLAYANASFPNILRVALFFVVIHCLAACLAVAAVMYFALPRLFGPGGALVGRNLPGMRGGRRGRGLFGVDEGAREELEFGFCFDVAIRAFLPVWFFLYIVQFLLLPVVTSQRTLSVLLANTLHLVAFAHGVYITFLGYNAIPSLSSMHLLLVAPMATFLALWAICTAVGWNASLHLAPILWAAGGLRKTVG